MGKNAFLSTFLSGFFKKIDNICNFEKYRTILGMFYQYFCGIIEEQKNIIKMQ